MEKQKSKKDLAFERERANYRHEISTLQREIKENLREIEVLNQKILELEGSIRQKDDWIRRLLEYTDLTEEDIRNQIQKDMCVLKVFKHIEELDSMIFGFGKRFGV